MARRKVMVTVTDAEGANGRGVEGLRAAVGLARGFEGHQVSIMFRAGGIGWLVRDGERRGPAATGILAHLRASRIPRYVEAEAAHDLQVAGIALDEDVQVLDAAAAQSLLDAADVTLTY